MRRYNNLFLDSENEEISMLAEIKTEPIEGEIPINTDKDIPVIPLRNMVMFPQVVMPITVGRASTQKLVNAAYKSNQLVAVVCQRHGETESPEYDDLYHLGVVVKILRVFDIPGGNMTAFVQSSGQKIHLDAITQTMPYLKGKITLIPEDNKTELNDEFSVLIDSCKDLANKYIDISDKVNADMNIAIKNIESPEMLLNFICTNFPFTVEEKINLLRINTLKDRAYELLQVLNRENQLATIRQNIQMRTQEDINKQQKDYFLQQQIKSIQEELGDGQQSQIDELREQAKKKKWNDSVAETFNKELSRLERLNPQVPDYSVQLTYLQTLLSLPWNEYTQDNLNISNAEKVLNKDHYGLDKVKERILEHLAVLKFKENMKAPIICLYGPPGVGKTSLGKSIAAALKRKYVRMSLGGVHDEAEIRGHRKTYIGSMPGRIIKSLIKAGSSNPVIILDEIDKMGNDTKGDPSSAMLEVLDPEQNNAFHDNYLDMDYDLSRILFIATANNINNIPAPLLDRMEIIDVTGYIIEEKIEIAKRHLIPKEIENNGLDKNFIKIPKATIEYIIENYTSESGVRDLDHKIGKIMRKLALRFATEGQQSNVTVKPSDLAVLLGLAEHNHDKYQGNEYAGVVTGLAWTAVGGEILYIETSLSKGNGSRLNLTGNLGDVMKESAMLALEYLKSHSALFGIDDDIFDKWNVHIHVPEGAIPKDGPSAGITMATALASAFTRRKVKDRLAMTGEITLRGKVLPVGGIKEKILAAKRAGIKEIILCKDNRKNIEDIQPCYLKGLTFHYVSDVKEVIEIALTDEIIKDTTNFTLKKEKESK